MYIDVLKLDLQFEINFSTHSKVHSRKYIHTSCEDERRKVLIDMHKSLDTNTRVCRELYLFHNMNFVDFDFIENYQ
jgi:hypothetical protein